MVEITDVVCSAFVLISIQYFFDLGYFLHCVHILGRLSLFVVILRVIFIRMYGVIYGL